MNTVTVTYDPTQRSPWIVVVNGFDESHHRLKHAAEKEGRRLAKRNRPSEFVVETKSGNVTYTQRYER